MLGYYGGRSQLRYLPHGLGANDDYYSPRPWGAEEFAERLAQLQQLFKTIRILSEQSCSPEEDCRNEDRHIVR